MQDHIVIRGARTHNLKNINVTIPRNKLVVITGLSGSGKSSLAFDTIYAEGQRRYVESLSSYARQFLEQMDKPDVDVIEGLSPAVSVEQKSTSHNPRSTVGTTTEIYDYLRLLFARVGIPHCYSCGKPIQRQTVSQIVERLMTHNTCDRIFVLAPIVLDRKGSHEKEIQHARALGFVRIKVDGLLMDLSEEISLDKKKKHSIDVVVDRLLVSEENRSRLHETLESAFHLGDGLAKIEFLLFDKKSKTESLLKNKILPKSKTESPENTQKASHIKDINSSRTELLSTKNACVECGISYPKMEPQIFSFNSHQGACPKCDGLGEDMYVDEGLVVPNENLSIDKGAIVPWFGKKTNYYQSLLESLADAHGFSLSTPFSKLPSKVKTTLFEGSADFIRIKTKRHNYDGFFEGIKNNLMRRYKETESEWMRTEIAKFMSHQECTDCKGARLKRESLFVKIQGKNIFEYTQMSVDELLRRIEALKLSKNQQEIASPIIKEIQARLVFLINVGLGYLSLDRKSHTLSGGEAQRIRLATQIGSALVGVTYILDEPSIGLHQRDNDKLIQTLMGLRDIGNSVIVVEHDEDTILKSDYIIDLGPRAGVHGGEVVFAGIPSELTRAKNSLTADYISKKREIKVPPRRRQGSGDFLRIISAAENNLKNINVSFPLGQLICVTGVSGSGKSTLVNDTLYPLLMRALYGSKVRIGKSGGILGAELIDKVIGIDQSPIGRTPRSNPATYTQLFSHIRDLFSELTESKMRGYKPGRFSFNVTGGRCETCNGDGLIRIEMHFLPDVFVTCEACHGKRFNEETLMVYYKGKNIADVLKMTVEEALSFFQNIPSIKRKCETLMRVGLGYIELGQSATTLSGGEAQRIKLSRELSKRPTGKTLYILDEPTTGLHFEDVKMLLEVLGEIADSGNTVIVIEHNLHVIKAADHIIDLGPEGGAEGGKIVACGTPEEISRHPTSYTGLFLKDYL